MPLQATSGAASYDAFGGGVAAVPKYIEEYFSTFLYSGNDTTQAINNGIDLSTKGGMVWAKSRTSATNNIVWDTARGVQSRLTTNTTTAAVAGSTEFLSSFNTTGFTVTSTGSGTDPVNDALRNYVSWSFAKAPKFFDVVTYTGNGTVATTTGAATNYNRVISHNLGSSPGCYIVKRTDSTGNWLVAHIGASGVQLDLNTPSASSGATGQVFADATGFSPGTNRDLAAGGNTFNYWNESGATYVAYLFAHNAGGFGLTGTDNVISCGSYTGSNGAGQSINIGFEPQWLLVKNTSRAGQSWVIMDNMRQFDYSGYGWLNPNSSAAETAGTGSVYCSPTSTGFKTSTANAAIDYLTDSYIYIAIRRGPMKVPTSGTSVFIPVSATPSGATTVTTNFPVDLAINAQRDSSVSGNKVFWDRLRGSSTSTGRAVFSNLTNAEVSYGSNGIGLQSNTTIVDNYWNTLNGATTPVIYWNFRRAPSFFDEVCYTGTGYSVSQTLTHNLGVTPELMIAKDRTTGGAWGVYSVTLGATKYLQLNETFAEDTSQFYWGNTAPTSTQFTVKGGTNISGDNFVAYLFATCAGVSKCTAFTGTGTLQTINCGFTAGSRFVLIKRTDAAGDWYVWDSSRGLSSSTDPYLLLNSTAAEVTSTNWVDTTATGFQVTAASGNNVNISGASYIALAIA